MYSKKVVSIIMVLHFVVVLALSSISYSLDEISPQEELEVSIQNHFEFLESSDKIEEQTDVNSIDIALPGLDWNITGIEMNFTNLKLGRELKTVEDQEDWNDNLIYNQNPAKKRFALAVQMNLTENTTIYGIFIHGMKEEGTINDIMFQIRGYDELNDAPNATKYGEVILNISTVNDWYYQDFSSQNVELPKGSYSLVMNGTDLLEGGIDKYRWSLNDVDPTTPFLHSTEYVDDWAQGTINTTYLYKIDQKTDKTYKPSELNMNVTLNSFKDQVDDGTVLGTGNVSLQNINFNPNAAVLNIPIEINRTIQLSFTLNYELGLQHLKSFEGDLTIGENGNEWTLSPTIDRCNFNYSVKFWVPPSWEALKVFRDNVDVTASTSRNNGRLFIPNSTITVDSTWKISASAPKVDFKLDSPQETFEPGEKLKFTVNPPIEDGNLTFLLIDALDTEELEETGVVNSDEITFEYEFSSNPHEGKWTIIMFWNNETDAGVQIQEIEVVVPFTLTTEQIVFLSLVIGILVVASITSYTTIKRYRRRKEERRRRIFNKYMDALNLGMIIITEKTTGLDIFEQKFAGKEMDATLISGFLDAIRSFGLELTSSEDQTQTIKFDFKGSRVLMTEFKNFRIISVMLETPSNLFIDAINDLAKDIEHQYGEKLDKFRGDRSAFSGIQQLLEKHLLVSLIYPLNIVKTEEVKIHTEEKSMINRAKSMMKQKGSDYFFVSSLLAQRKGFQTDDAETILNLIHKKVFQPVYPVS